MSICYFIYHYPFINHYGPWIFILFHGLQSKITILLLRLSQLRLLGTPVWVQAPFWCAPFCWDHFLTMWCHELFQAHLAPASTLEALFLVVERHSETKIWMLDFIALEGHCFCVLARTELGNVSPCIKCTSLFLCPFVYLLKITNLYQHFPFQGNITGLIPTFTPSLFVLVFSDGETLALSLSMMYFLICSVLEQDKVVSQLLIYNPMRNECLNWSALSGYSCLGPHFYRGQSECCLRKLLKSVLSSSSVCGRSTSTAHVCFVPLALFLAVWMCACRRWHGSEDQSYPDQCHRRNVVVPVTGLLPYHCPTLTLTRALWGTHRLFPVYVYCMFFFQKWADTCRFSFLLFFISWRYNGH